MMSRLGLLLLAVTLNPRALAQDQRAETRTDLLERIYFSALDKDDRPFLGLAARDFKVRVNGKAAALEGFSPGRPQDDRSIPLAAWILIDWNPNINARVIKGQADAAAEIFRMFHPDSVVGVKLVSDRSETVAPLAHEAKALREAFLQFADRRLTLDAAASGESVVVGPAGIVGALESAVDELDRFVASHPSLRRREVHRTIMVLSDANINPRQNRKRLYQRASEKGVSLYPVFTPRDRYGAWVESFFELGRKTGGVAALLGALNPAVKWDSLPHGNADRNALTFNFIHMVRDLNARYSFVVHLAGDAKETRLDLKCLRRNVRIRLPRAKITRP